MAENQNSDAREVNAPVVNDPNPQAPANNAATQPDAGLIQTLEDAHIAAPAVATTSRRSKTFANSCVRAPKVRATPVNDMRLATVTKPLLPKRYPNQNAFIPAFGMMFNLLSTMNDSVAQIHKFSDRGSVSSWIPQVSTLVYSVLGYIQVLRAAQVAHRITPDQEEFLSFFLSHYPLGQLTIPGPLIPFFRSISVASPGFSTFENVTPFIPPMTFSEDSLYSMRYRIPGTEPAAYFSGIAMMLPHIPLMMDQFQFLISSAYIHTAAQPFVYSSTTPLSNIFGVSQTPEPGALRDGHTNLKTSVGYWDRPIAADGLLLRAAPYFINRAEVFPAPWRYTSDHAPVTADTTSDPPVAARPAAWITYSTFKAFMQMNTHHAWFGELLTSVQKFTKYWNDNTTLADISPVHSSAGLILFKQVERSAISTSRFGQTINGPGATHRLVYNTKAWTACPFFTTEDFEDAQVAQVNIESTTSFNNRHIGDIGVTRFGPFWDCSHAYAHTDRADLTPGLRLKLTSSEFFTEKE